MGMECGDARQDRWHSDFDADTLARRYVRSLTIHYLIGVGIVAASLAGLLMAARTGSEWWIMVAALPAIPFYAGYLWYRREDARDWGTALDVAAEREGWCQCVDCGSKRLGALIGRDSMECWSPNSGVDDIINNTPAGSRFRAADARFENGARARCGRASC